MRLAILTPRAVVVDEDVRYVRAEDATGAFGVLKGHADFFTSLAISVVVYRDVEDVEHFVAVRGGMLTVSGGRRVDVVTREAVKGDDLERLERDVLTRFRKSLDVEERAAGGIKRLEGALLRRVADYVRLEGGRRPPPLGKAAWRA